MWQAQALQEFNNRSASLAAYFTSCLCLLLKLAENLRVLLYIFRLGTANTPGQARSEIHSKYVYIYTNIHLFMVPKKYAWHKHLEAS